MRVRAANLRINRRLFWSGFAVMAIGTALAAKPYPWVLNGGFVLPWILLHGARLHDLGRRGLWACVVVSIALLSLIVLVGLKPPVAIYGPAALVAFLGLLSFTAWAGAKPGNPGPNRYGRPPQGWRPGW